MIYAKNNLKLRIDSISQYELFTMYLIGYLQTNAEDGKITEKQYNFVNYILDILIRFEVEHEKINSSLNQNLTEMYLKIKKRRLILCDQLDPEK